MKVLFALFALVAIAAAQNTAFIDDFFAVVPREAATLRISSFADTEIEDFNCASTAGEGNIVGDCHVLHLAGFAASGCEPTASVSLGAMFCNNAFNCAAECSLQLDGNGETTFTRSGGLNGRNFNAEGFAFRIFAGTDVATDFTIRAYSGGSVSRVSRAIPAGSSSGNFVQYDINFSDFSDPSALSSTDTLEIVVPQVFDTDVVLTDWEILSNEADIFGSVFDDCGCDGVRDQGDLGVANVVVTLTSDSSCVTEQRTTTTNSAGDYSFVGLAPCTYSVSITNVGSLCSGDTNPRSVPLGATSVFNVNFRVASDSVFTIPQDVTVNCNQGTSPSSTGTASSSICGSVGTVSFTDTISNQLCDASFTINRVWTDGTQSGTQTIVVTDTNQGPTLFGVPDDVLISCNADTSINALGNPTATDDCSTASVAHSDSPLVSACNQQTCTSENRFTRTFTSVDDCGNTGQSATQLVELDCDAGPAPCNPQRIPVPVPVTVTIPGSIPTPVVESPSPVISTNRNCRFICDDDDSAASFMAISSVLVALVALFAMM